jgi:hypothetical protein
MTEQELRIKRHRANGLLAVLAVTNGWPLSGAFARLFIGERFLDLLAEGCRGRLQSGTMRLTAVPHPLLRLKGHHVDFVSLPELQEDVQCG